MFTKVMLLLLNALYVVFLHACSKNSMRALKSNSLPNTK